MYRSIEEDPVKRFVRKVVILDANATVEKAARTMRDEHIGSILVSEKDEPVGILTERDILYKIVAEGKDPSKLEVKDVMSRPLLSIDADAKVINAITLMASKQIRRLVVKEGKNVFGVIEMENLL